MIQKKEHGRNKGILVYAWICKDLAMHLFARVLLVYGTFPRAVCPRLNSSTPIFGNSIILKS